MNAEAFETIKMAQSQGLPSGKTAQILERAEQVVRTAYSVDNFQQYRDSVRAKYHPVAKEPTGPVQLEQTQLPVETNDLIRLVQNVNDSMLEMNDRMTRIEALLG